VKNQNRATLLGSIVTQSQEVTYDTVTMTHFRVLWQIPSPRGDWLTHRLEACCDFLSLKSKNNFHYRATWHILSGSIVTVSQHFTYDCVTMTHFWVPRKHLSLRRKLWAHLGDGYLGVDHLYLLSFKWKIRIEPRSLALLWHSHKKSLMTPSQWRIFGCLDKFPPQEAADLRTDWRSAVIFYL
jgi:hypothetical protein